MRNDCCVTLKEFIQADGVVLDVRSPSEFAHARLPGAINLPLFTDSERAVVGTLYKRAGKQAAVEEGFKLVGPKLYEIIAFAKEHLGGKTAKIYCWRGGLRSGSVAWLLSMVGLSVITLQGGYKSFRRFVRSFLNSVSFPRLIVLGGLTGSGKTALLKALKERGEQVLDLETLAGHRGSSFGSLGLGAQPSNEQFESEMAMCLSNISSDRPIWVEDESRLIGRCQIPDFFFSSCARLL